MKKNIIVIFDTADDTYVGNGDQHVKVPRQARPFPFPKDQEEEEAGAAALATLQEEKRLVGTMRAIPMLHYDGKAIDEIIPFRPATTKFNERFAAFEKLPGAIRTTCYSQTSGTTTHACELNVLYFGRHVALINHRGGGYSDNGGRHYMSGWVERVRIGQTFRHTVRDFKCDRTEQVHHVEKDGRLTEERLQKLILDASEFDLQYPKLRAAEKAQKQAKKDRIAEVQAQQTAYWKAVAKQAAEVGGEATIATSFDRPVLGIHDNINGVEMVRSSGRVEIGPFVIHMHATYRVKNETGGEWEVTKVDVRKDAIPSAEPLALLAALPALPFKEGVGDEAAAARNDGPCDRR